MDDALRGLTLLCLLCTVYFGTLYPLFPPTIALYFLPTNCPIFALISPYLTPQSPATRYLSPDLDLGQSGYYCRESLGYKCHSCSVLAVSLCKQTSTHQRQHHCKDRSSLTSWTKSFLNICSITGHCLSNCTENEVCPPSPTRSRSCENRLNYYGLYAPTSDNTNQSSWLVGGELA